MFKKSWLSEPRKVIIITALLIGVSFIMFPFVSHGVKMSIVNWYPYSCYIVSMYPLHVLRALKKRSYIDVLPISKKKLFVKEMICFFIGLMIYLIFIGGLTFTMKQSLLGGDVLRLEEVIREIVIIILAITGVNLLIMTVELFRGIFFDSSGEVAAVSLVSAAIFIILFVIFSFFIDELSAIIITFSLSLAIFLIFFYRVDLKPL